MLGGTLRPEEVSLSRDYAACFAVLEGSRSAPEGFRELYRNADFALYASALDPPGSQRAR